MVNQLKPADQTPGSSGHHFFCPTQGNHCAQAVRVHQGGAVATTRWQHKARAAKAKRFKRRVQKHARAVASSLGHTQREAVYQRALALELAADKYTVTTEHPIPVMYTVQRPDGPTETHTLAQERADIVVTEAPIAYALEIKKADRITADAVAQVQRYQTNYKRATGASFRCLGVVAFPRGANLHPSIQWI